jgi:hypothetical protein
MAMNFWIAFHELALVALTVSLIFLGNHLRSVSRQIEAELRNLRMSVYLTSSPENRDDGTSMYMGREE